MVFGYKVTIHCSLRAVGEIENGADGLIDGFCQYLTDGLFIVPTHTWANVDKEHPHYDVRNTEPSIGALSKVAAFRSDGVRSLHPTHSVTVFGKGAADYVKGEENAPFWGDERRVSYRTTTRTPRPLSVV